MPTAAGAPVKRKYSTSEPSTRTLRNGTTRIPHTPQGMIRHDILNASGSPVKEEHPASKPTRKTSEATGLPNIPTARKGPASTPSIRDFSTCPLQEKVQHPRQRYGTSQHADCTKRSSQTRAACLRAIDTSLLNMPAARKGPASTPTIRDFSTC